MSADLMITKELESDIFRWLTHEVVSLIRQSERRGTEGIKYLTKLKLHKLLYMVTEDCKIDLTRVWYMYGGIVCAPFDIYGLSQSFYNRRDQISDTELSSLKQRLGISKISLILDTLADKFPGVFFKEGREFLMEFYEDRAPEKFQKIYRTFRSLVDLYNTTMSPDRTLDIKYQRLLPTYDPWHQAHRLQGYLSDFHVEAAKIIDKDILRMVVEFTDLLEKVVVRISWMRHQEEEITSLHPLFILARNFENTAWKLVANHIAIETASGVRADEVRERFQEAQTEIMNNLVTEIRDQTNFLKSTNLLPKASILKEYFETKYGDMLREVMGTESVR